MKKKTSYLLLCVLSLVLGFICGAIVWTILKLINVLTEAVWEILPTYIPVHSLIYNLIVCCIGAILIVLIARKFGTLPHLTEEVMEIIKKDGGYPYNRLLVCVSAAVIPLVFGGTLGPEAGIVGVIAGLCCWVGDNLKYRGETLQTLAETGVSIAFGIVFMTPLPGIIANLEPSNKTEKYSNKFKNKANRIVIYCIGVAGGFIAFILLNMLWNLLFPGFGEGGLPRFTRDYTFDPMLLLWAIPLIVVGIIAGGFYSAINLTCQKIRTLFRDNRIIPALIAAVALAVCGYFFPESMFSGEHQLGPLINDYQSFGALNLTATGLLKLFLVCLCINFGWRGGPIFPIISGSAFLAYACAMIAGINGNFAAAVCIAATYSYIQRQPLLVTAILLLCFPLSYIPIIFISAFITAKIPNPFIKETDKISESKNKTVRKKENKNGDKNKNHK